MPKGRGPTTQTKRAFDAVSRVAKTLIGRTIVSVDLRLFDPDPDCSRNLKRPPTSDPRIVFDDGSVLSIVVDETETGEYGVTLVHSNMRAASKPRNEG